jgi:hypothetical protein
MPTTSPEPGTLFDFGDPPDQSPVVAKKLRDKFTALGRTHFTTDKTAPGNQPAFPATPQDGMPRINAADPTNIKLEFWLPGTGGGSQWRTALQFLNLGLSAPAKQIIAFPGPTPPNPWQVDHNIGSQVVPMAFDSLWFAFQVVPNGGGSSSAPSKLDKNKAVAAPTAGDNANTGLAVAVTPVGYIGVSVRGVSALVGDGTKVGVECYFSGDGGVTARAQGAVVAGDILYWNGVAAGYNLLPSDRVDFFYNAAGLGSLGANQCVIQQSTPNRVLVTFNAPTPGFLVLVG